MRVLDALVEMDKRGIDFGAYVADTMGIDDTTHALLCLLTDEDYRSVKAQNVKPMLLLLPMDALRTLVKEEEG